MKKWIAILLSMAMAMTLLAGCSGGGDETQGTGAQGEAPEEAVTIEFWHSMVSTTGELIQEIVDEYNTGLPAYKKIHSLKVRETEFEKTPSKKIKRF